MNFYNDVIPFFLNLASSNIPPILTLLFQGMIGGLVVLFVTNQLSKRKLKSLTQKHAFLVYLEIRSHVSKLEILYETEQVPKDLYLWALSTDSWKDSKIHLTSLDISFLKELGEYYQLVDRCNFLIKIAPYRKPTEVIRNTFKLANLTSQAMEALLSCVWDSANYEKHAACFHKYYQQASSFRRNHFD